VEFEIELSGAEENAGRLERLAARMDKVGTQKIEDQLELIVAFLESEVKKRTPVDTGALYSSTFGEVRTSGVALEGLVSTPLVYGPPIEFGTKRGIKPHKMFGEAWEQNISKVKDLLDEIGVHVSEELLRLL